MVNVTFNFGRFFTRMCVCAGVHMRTCVCVHMCVCVCVCAFVCCAKHPFFLFKWIWNVIVLILIFPLWFVRLSVVCLFCDSKRKHLWKVCLCVCVIKEERIWGSMLIDKLMHECRCEHIYTCCVKNVLLCSFGCVIAEQLNLFVSEILNTGKIWLKL